VGGEAAELAAVVHDALEARLPEYDPWFYRYCGSLASAEGVEKYLRHKTDLLDFAGIDPCGARILDAGAGFGLTLVVLASLGATLAQGIEFHGPMVRTARAYMPRLPAHFRNRIAIDEGNVMAMPYPDDSFDAVLSVEAISHYRDVEAALQEMRRVLRPGGVIAVSDGNNGLNPATRRKTREIWDAFELGTSSGRVHGHNVEHVYQRERQDFIEREFPEVPAEKMARRTFAMTFPEIREACVLYERDEVYPESVYDGSVVPVNPADGQVIERLFDPYELGRQFEELGFSVRVSGYWGGASGRRSLRLANAILSRFSRLTIYSARGFLIAAAKAGDGRPTAQSAEGGH
jgi:SAM-dependent methyltransferase